MSRLSYGICKCGHGDNVTEFRVQDKLWCCKTMNDNCTISGDYPIQSVNCTGIALSLSEECHSQTCNYYPTDEYRNGEGGYSYSFPRSHLNICGDGRYTANIFRIELIHRF